MTHIVSTSWYRKLMPESGVIRRLMLFATASGVFLAIIVSSFSSYYEYRDQWALLERNLTEIKDYYIHDITRDVCSKDIAQLSRKLNEIKNGQHIAQVSVTDGQRELAVTGGLREGMAPVIRQYPVSCLDSGDKISTAILTVTASSDHIPRTAETVFLLTFAKIIVLLALMLTVIVWYLRQNFILPLRETAIHAGEYSEGCNIQTPLQLNRRVASSADELDDLARAMDGMRAHLSMLTEQAGASASRLQAQALLFRSVIEAAESAVYWKDERGVYAGCSKSFALLSGCGQPDGVIGKTDLDLPLLASHAREIKALEAAACAELRSSQSVLKCESPAGLRLIRLYCAPLRGGGVAGTIADHTRRHEEKQNLHRSEGYLNGLFESPAACMAILSSRKTIIRANTALCSMLGYDQAELQQKSWVDLVRQDDFTRDIEQFELLHSGTIRSFTRRTHLLKKAGEEALSDITVSGAGTEGQPETYCAVIQDVSENGPVRQLRMLTSAVDLIQEIIIITDTEDVIQYVNPAFTRSTGYAAQDVVGKTPSLLRSGKHDPGFYSNLHATISRGEIWRGRFINKKRDGDLYTEEATIYPIRGETSAISNYLAVKRDITHDLKIEHQLRQVQKMEAIGTLAGGIAHDFNNILGVIYGYAEMSMDPEETLPQISSNLQQVVSATNRAKDLIRQILTISRQTEKEAMPVTITPIVKEVIKFIRASLPSSIRISQSLEAKNDLLLADPIQIHQLLMNLCTNAGQAMKDRSGVLDISLKNVHLSEPDIREYPLMRSGDYLCLSVSDTGCGIPAENMEHIFEPYFTTKEAGEGTGLGLAVVHGIVRNCGGDIRVYSEPGKGTVFNVYLPLIIRDAEKLSEPDKEIPSGKEHIMFVDDEISLVKTSKILLERLGYTVTGMTSSDEALAAFKRAPEAFDMIITDKTMPELTGFDLVREIKSHRPDLPIILCTGVSAKNDIDMIREMGINGFILKPFNKRELAGIVREVLDKASSERTA